mgnify:FL=1
MVRAVNELDAYLARKTAELRSADVLLRGLGLNYRQTDVLGRFLRDPGLSTSVADHQARYGFVAQTARTDLTDLARRGYLDSSKQGRRVVWHPVGDLPARLGV